MNQEREKIVKETISACRGIIDRLVNQHLELETEPLPFFDRVAILHETQPEPFNIDDAKLMLSIAVAMLVEEREKNK